MLKSRLPTWRGRAIAPPEGLFCNFSGRTCMRNRVEGFELCIRHILDDKNCPFKQCQYVSTKSGRRCPHAAPKTDKKDGYCWEHATRVSFQRQRAVRRKRPRDTPETIFEELAQYVPLPTDNNQGESGVRKRASITNNLSSKVLEYASSSDSEAEAPLVEQAWKGDAESDCDSIDSDQDDPLKHAGVYTAEEVALIMRDKLIRLQSLYIDQFRRLQYVMREKRRAYLHDVKQERETLCGLSAYKSDPENRDKYNKLQALKRYHKRHGKEALLHRRCKERRISLSDGIHHRAPYYQKCIYNVTGSGRCNDRTVPLSKYCMTHILHDPNQVLFQGCSFADGTCNEPVPALTDVITCPSHRTLFEHVMSEETLPALLDASQYQQDTPEEEVDNGGMTESMDVDESTGLDTMLITSSEEPPIDTTQHPTCARDASLGIAGTDDVCGETAPQVCTDDEVMMDVLPRSAHDDVLQPTCAGDAPVPSTHPTCAGDAPVPSTHPTGAGDAPVPSTHPTGAGDAPAPSTHPTYAGDSNAVIMRNTFRPTGDTSVNAPHPVSTDETPMNAIHPAYATNTIHPACDENGPETEPLLYNSDMMVNTTRTNHNYAAVTPLTDHTSVTEITEHTSVSNTQEAERTSSTATSPSLPASTSTPTSSQMLAPAATPTSHHMPTPPPISPQMAAPVPTSTSPNMPTPPRTCISSSSQMPAPSTSPRIPAPPWTCLSDGQSTEHVPANAHSLLTHVNNTKSEHLTTSTSEHSYQKTSADTPNNDIRATSRVMTGPGLINTIISTSASSSFMNEGATEIVGTDRTSSATNMLYRSEDSDYVAPVSAGEGTESHQLGSHAISYNNISVSELANYPPTHTVLTNNLTNSDLNLRSNLSNIQMLPLPVDSGLANLHLLAEISSVPSASRSSISSSGIAGLPTSGMSRQISNEDTADTGEISNAHAYENT